MNPLSFIFDLEVRDIAEYLKSLFFSDDEFEDVAFEDLKEDWICPLCAAPKEEFSKIL